MRCGFYKKNELHGSLYQEYLSFLSQRGLRDEADWDMTVLFLGDDERIAACGSLKERLIKQIAVDSSMEGEGLASSVISELSNAAAENGITDLFLWTKPSGKRLFGSLGFYTLAETGDAVMMENRKNGLESFLNNCLRYSGRVGAIVCNCNPFTLGHRMLMETAAAAVDHLLIFVLSADRFMFSSEERFKMVREGTKDIDNIDVIRGGDYLISPSLFPAYFIKNSAKAESARCELDLILFAQKIAPALNITRRFVGSEPFDSVTAEYNRRMRELLPEFGIEVTEIERYGGINATAIRQAIAQGDIEKYRAWIPESSYVFCRDRAERYIKSQG